MPYECFRCLQYFYASAFCVGVHQYYNVFCFIVKVAQEADKTFFFENFCRNCSTSGTLVSASLSRFFEKMSHCTVKMRDCHCLLESKNLLFLKIIKHYICSYIKYSLESEI